MKQKQIIINNFSGGISDDVREQSDKKFAISQHFDNTTSPQKLTPFRDSVDDNTTQVGIMNFALGTTNTDTYLYGLGLTLSGGLKVQIYRKTTANDLTSAWVTPAGSTSTSLTHPIGNTFVNYKETLYLRSYTNTLDTYTPATSTYVNGAYTLSGATSLADGSAPSTQGVVHSKSDALYIGVLNKIWQNNNVQTPGYALTLPSDLYISALAEYGSYLAIGCRPKVSGSGNSKVFLWNMIDNDVTEVLDFGAGDLWILGNVEGRLVAVMNEADSGGITFPKKKVYIKIYSGGTPELFKTLEDTSLSLMGLLGYKPFFSNINGLTFGLYSTGEKVPTGLYTFSRGAGQGYQITSSRFIHNSTAITNLVGIYKVGQVVFTAYNYVADTSTSVGRTSDAEIYNDTAYMISQRFNDGDPSQVKSLDSVSCFYPPLPTGTSITLSFRKDEETTWTEIFTDSTVNSTSHEALNIEPNAVNFDPFKEIQFKIESTGGAENVGFKFLFTPQANLIQ
jgi:hypothetical protein